MHESKRKEFMQQIKGGIAIFPSALPALRTHDVEYKYRQGSNFYYLTGFENRVQSVFLRQTIPNTDMFYLSVLAFQSRKYGQESVWESRGRKPSLVPMKPIQSTSLTI